jgi:hypothetical protein
LAIAQPKRPVYPEPMQTRYLVRMLGIAVIHIIAFVTFMTIAGQFEGLIIALPMNLTVLVVINLAGA